MRTWTSILLAGLLMAADSLRPDLEILHKHELDGIWTLESFEFDGRRLLCRPVQTWTFDGRRLVMTNVMVRGNGHFEVATGTVHAGVEAGRNTIDIDCAYKVRGIYQVQDGTLTIAGFAGTDTMILRRALPR